MVDRVNFIKYRLNGKKNAYYVIGIENIDDTGIINIPRTFRNLPVTKIDKRAFSCCEKLRKIYIPDTIKTISEYSFYSCINLSEVNGCEKIINIKESAFYNCNKLLIINLNCNINVEMFAFTNTLLNKEIKHKFPHAFEEEDNVTHILKLNKILKDYKTRSKLGLPPLKHAKIRSNSSTPYHKDAKYPGRPHWKY